MFLLGLTVQSQSDRVVAVQVEKDTFARRADELLREFHDRILADTRRAIDPETQTVVDRPDSLGLLAREAIYYGANSFYLH